MTRRLTLQWPVIADDGAFRGPVRILAVSDEPDPALDFERNRAALGEIDVVVGAGDLQPHYLAFLADAFKVPLVYVRGNHDRGPNWQGENFILPQPLGVKSETVAGLSFMGLSWPGDERKAMAVRDEKSAWRQAIGVAVRRPGSRPLIIVSHVPPRGLGDSPEDHYHLGFEGYHWLCRRMHPTLWIHGHTSMAAVRDWRVTWGETTFVNATGAVLIELTGKPVDAGTIASRGLTENAT